MKQFSKLFFAAAVAALGLASCAKEVAQVETPKDNLVTVHFGATAGIEGATKATLTTEDELTFTSAWENGDELSVKYTNDNETEGATTSGIVSASWSTDHFEATMPEYKGWWDYNVVYPAPDADSKVDFGSTRTQKGNAYNSKYDLMKGSAIAEGADAGKTADRKDIVFEMTRQTAIAYFHFTSALDEEVVSAKLSVEGNGAYLSTSDVQIGRDNSGNIDYAKGFVFKETEGAASKEINLTFTGEAPKSSDFKLWFNVLPTIYDKMTLTVETTNNTLTISRTAEGMYEAGKLYKVVKKEIPAEKWAPKAAYTGGDLVFNFKTHPKGWPAEENKNAGNYDYELSGVKYAFNLSTNVYCKGTSGDNGYLMISGKNDNALLGLPAISGFKLTKIVATINDQVTTISSKTMVAITDGVNVVAGGVAQNWKTKGAAHTYTLTETEENTVYYMYATKANAQMMKLVLSYEPATPSAPKYSVSFASVDGGTLSASAIKAEEGTEITLTAEPQLGYEFNNDWSVTATDGTVINVVDNKFTMPAQDVTVSGTFSESTSTPTFASLAELVATGAPSTTARKVTVTLTDEEIIRFHTLKDGTVAGAIIKVGTQEVEIFCTGTPSDWKVGGTISGTLTNCDWMLYVNKSTQKETWELCPAGYSELTYKAPLPTCATPVITVAEDGAVSIACETAGATIHYTVGDSPADPTEADAVFNTVTLTEGQTIKAIAVAKDHKPSAVASKKYTVGGATSYFVKVTTAPTDWSGTYLIVYEAGNVAFNGSLTTLDDERNTVSVTISNNKIEATDALMKSVFVIDGKAGSLKSASGYYVGYTGKKNGMNTNQTTVYKNVFEFDAKTKVITIKSSNSYLKYNSASNQTRFRYYASGQSDIQLYKLAN